MAIELTLLPRVTCRDKEISSPRLRSLLALLAGDLRRGCSTARLVDGLWPDAQPENPTKALQVLVFRARAQLGADLIASTPSGYRLALSEDQVDTSAVVLGASAAAEQSRAGDHAAALAHADAGLALWEGAPDDDVVPDDPVAMLRADRASTYGSLVRARALALARLGRCADAVAPLAEAFLDRRRDEEVLLELLRCEAKVAGPAAGLGRYETYRRSLRDELGTDPGPALQAVHRELLQESAPKVRHGVPHEPNVLLGRDDDVAAVAELLRTSRVASIVGAGGLGKTRLAYAVSRSAEQRVVHVVSLAGVRTDSDVAREVASVLGIGDSGRASGTAPAAATDVFASIAKALGASLLVLDNCEHVIDGVAELVQALLATTRDLRVLTTSRAPLGLSSEAVYLLPELSLATSAELFGQRARAARPDVGLPSDQVTELCRHLDGLPLAVELAAARVRVMSVGEIAERLQDRFALLRSGPRDAPQRHRTLHAVVDWSWQLLDPSGQAAMRALSVFPGGFTADAAQHVLGDGDAREVLDVLESLVDQSLLVVSERGSSTRFRMLETVREFSAAELEQADETDRVVSGFLSWARAFGLQHHESLLANEPFPAAERIRAEQDNLVQALRQALTASDGATVAATSAVLAGLWTIEASYARLVTLADETAWLLSHFRPEPDMVEVTRTASVLCATNMFMLQGPRAARALVTLRRLPPAPPDTLTRALAIVLAAAPEVLDPDRSALRALCARDEPLLAGVANSLASYVWENDGDQEGALSAAERAVDAFDDLASPLVRVTAHSRVGELCLQLERGDDAVRQLNAALALMTALGGPSDALGIQWALVTANLQRGAVDEAERCLELAARDGIDDTYGLLTFDLAVRAEIRLARGEVDAGLHLWREAVARLEDTGSLLFYLDQMGGEPWALEIRAVAVVAHAQHGQLQLVEEQIAQLPHTLSMLLENPVVNPPAFVMGLALCGTGLLALAMTDLDRGARTDDERATTSGVRLVALAERLRFLRQFQPTMSAARAAQAAGQADRSAYDDAVSSYADLDRDELRAVALAALRARALSGSTDRG